MFSPSKDSDASARLRMAVNMHGEAVKMMEMNLRRRYPNDSEHKRQLRLRSWLGDTRALSPEDKK